MKHAPIGEAAARVVLWGRDHETLGRVGTTNIGRSVALAMSCGNHPKPYPTVDLNEDVVLAVRSGHATLLAVADGSRGNDAAHAAGAALLAEAGLGVMADPAEVARLVRAVDAALTRMRVRAEDARQASRTAMTVAIAATGTVVAATRGDTALVRLRGNDCAVLSGVAPAVRPPPLPQPQTAKIRHGDVLMVASDGLFDYLGDGWVDAVPEAVQRHDDLGDAATSLVCSACHAGAGDNVSVGLLRVS